MKDSIVRLVEGEDQLEQKMKEIKSRNPNTPIYFAGHSLGGALAQIAAAVLGDDNTAACYTFGSPESR
jgi:thioesterase domain-containing protein